MPAKIPLLANIYRHYVFDLWVQRWRRKQAHGDVVVVRYADDFVMGFEHRKEGERFVAEFRQRFVGFGLELHPDNTRLIEFCRYAAANRRERGEGKPQTFNFLGFTGQVQAPSYSEILNRCQVQAPPLQHFQSAT